MFGISMQFLCFLLVLFNNHSNAFLLPWLRFQHRPVVFRLDASQLPTLEQLSKDPFMQQVQYGSELSNALLEDPGDLPSDGLKDLLRAQLSHSDGIRGFMVSYLTVEDSNQESFEVPNILVEALREQAQSNPDDLIPLACMLHYTYFDSLRTLMKFSCDSPFRIFPIYETKVMNVIMPTAMSTMHEQEELRQSSASTAERGLCVLKTLTGQNPLVEDNARAILAVATGEERESAPLSLMKVCMF